MRSLISTRACCELIEEASFEITAEVGKMVAAAREKSNFKQTCSLLSQYLKEKGSFAGLGLGMACGFAEQQGAGFGLLQILRFCVSFFDVCEQQGRVLMAVVLQVR